MYGIDAFSFLVRKDGMTLLDVAEETHVHASDLLEINPELKRSSASICGALEKASLVKLPIYLRYRGAPHGRIFVIHEEESRLQRLDQHINEKLMQLSLHRERDQLEHLVLPLPRRKLKSKAEQVLEVVYKEADLQLGKVLANLNVMSSSKKEEENEYNKIATKHIHRFVDVSAVKKKEDEVEEAFCSKCVPLHSFKDENQHILHLNSQIKNPHEAVSFSNPQPQPSVKAMSIAVNEDHHCVEHTHRWEFSFCKTRSTEVQETWAVLSCQRLTILAEVFQCPLQQYISHVDSFMIFIGGTFYVDGEEDLSEMIRHFDPGATTKEEGVSLDSNPSFSRCEVKPAQFTTIGELKVRMGEVGVYRHLGCCDHYFFLKSVSCLTPSMGSRDQKTYPRLISLQRRTVIRCFNCKKFPSTIALYKKVEIETPGKLVDPMYLCDICYESLLGETQSVEYIKVVPPSNDYYFTC